MSDILATPLRLPCGAEIPNRLAKTAMTEGLATPEGVPTRELERLYGRWSDGGAGMLLSGDIQIDRSHLERPGNVVIEPEPDAEMRMALARWAQSATRKGNHFWAQISHAGRQTMKNVNPHPKAPSAVKVGLPLCVDTDAPAQLLAGAEELNRYESRLSLFPPWLSFLGRWSALRSVAGFAVQFWFYAQLDELGREGRAKPDITVFAATRRILGLQKQLLAGR